MVPVRHRVLGMSGAQPDAMEEGRRQKRGKVHGWLYCVASTNFWSLQWPNDLAHTVRQKLKPCQVPAVKKWPRKTGNNRSLAIFMDNNYTVARNWRSNAPDLWLFGEFMGTSTGYPVKYYHRRDTEQKIGRVHPRHKIWSNLAIKLIASRTAERCHFWCLLQQEWSLFISTKVSQTLNTTVNF